MKGRCILEDHLGIIFRKSIDGSVTEKEERLESSRPRGGSSDGHHCRPVLSVEGALAFSGILYPGLLVLRSILSSIGQVNLLVVREEVINDGHVW